MLQIHSVLFVIIWYLFTCIIVAPAKSQLAESNIVFDLKHIKEIYSFILVSGLTLWRSSKGTGSLSPISVLPTHIFILIGGDGFIGFQFNVSMFWWISH